MMRVCSGLMGACRSVIRLASKSAPTCRPPRTGMSNRNTDLYTNSFTKDNTNRKLRFIILALAFESFSKSLMEPIQR